MRGVISFILCISLTLAFFVGCDRSYDEAEVKAAAEQLLEKSLLVNEIFYGEGLEYDENSIVSSGSYSPATASALSELGISSTDGLRNLAKEVYTDGLCDIIFRTKLSSLKDGDGGDIVSLTRYFDKNVKGTNYLMVYTLDEANYDNEIEYLYETLTVTGADGEYIMIEVDVLLTSGIGLTRSDRVEFILLEENDGFRLDTLSFVKF